MQTQLFGNLAQHQRTHRQFAVGKEVFLALHHSSADAQDGVKTLLDVFDKPARLLQALLQAGVAGAGFVVAQHISVNIVHAQARHHLRVELHPKAWRHAFFVDGGDQYIGHDDVALHIDKTPAGLGLQAGDQRNRFAHQAVATHAKLHQALDVASGQ